MKRSTIYLTTLLAATLPAATLSGCDDGFQAVDMDEGGVPGGPAGTARGPTDAAYRDAATGTVGTDASPTVVTGDGREGPDTVYSPAGAQQQPDTIR